MGMKDLNAQKILKVSGPQPGANAVGDPLDFQDGWARRPGDAHALGRAPTLHDGNARRVTQGAARANPEWGIDQWRAASRAHASDRINSPLSPDEWRQAVQNYISGRDALSTEQIERHVSHLDEEVSKFNRKHAREFKHNPIAPSIDTYAGLATIGALAVGGAVFAATGGLGTIAAFNIALPAASMVASQLATGLGMVFGWWAGGSVHNFFFRRAFRAGATEVASRLKIAEESPAEPQIILEFMEEALKFMSYQIGGNELVGQMMHIKATINNSDAGFNPGNVQHRINKMSKLDNAREHLHKIIDELDQPGHYLDPRKNLGSIYRRLPWNADLTGDMTQNVHRRFKAFVEVYIKMLMLNEMYRSTASFEARSHLERTMMGEVKPLLSKEEGKGEMPFQQLLLAWKHTPNFLAYRWFDWSSLTNMVGGGKQKTDWQWRVAVATVVGAPWLLTLGTGIWAGQASVPFGAWVGGRAVELGALLKSGSILKP